MYALGFTVVGQEKLPEAKCMLQMVLQSRSQRLGDDHHDTLEVLSVLASMLRREKKYEESCQLYRKVLSLREKSIGELHPDTLVTMNDLAVSLRKLGNVEEAEALYRQVLTMNRIGRCADHPDTLTGMLNLASLLYHQKRDPEAEELLRQGLKLREGRYGDEHPELLRTLSYLILIHEKRGKQDEVMQLSQKIAQIGKVAVRDGVEMNKDLKKIIENALWKLAVPLYKQERYAEAEELLRQILKLEEEMYGLEEQPELLLTLDYLIAIHEKRGEPDEVMQLLQRIAELGK